MLDITPIAQPLTPPRAAVDSLKEYIENMMMTPIDETKRLIAKHIMVMPKTVADMRMVDFLREHGGSVQAANQKRKQDAK